MAQGESRQIIFSMANVSRVHPPHRQVLKDISLSFYYGAKIGVIGLNGSGKSSLLKIIAGVDKDFQGEVIPARDYSLGFLEQEPQLDPEKTVKQVISEAVQPVLDKLAEFDKRQRGLRRPGAERGRHGKTDRPPGRHPGETRRDGRLEPRHPPGKRHGRPALPARRFPDRHPLRRRKAARGPVPPAAAGARHPAARRADQPPRRRVGAVARASPAGIQGDGHRRHP